MWDAVNAGASDRHAAATVFRSSLPAAHQLLHALSGHPYRWWLRCLFLCLQGPAIWRALLDAASTMLLALRQLLQDRHLPHAVQEELSVFSGGTLHHVAKLLAHTLMYHATLVVSPKGRHILRLLLAGSCLADILPGTFESSWDKHQSRPAFNLVRNAGNAAPMRACICAGFDLVAPSATARNP